MKGYILAVGILFFTCFQMNGQDWVRDSLEKLQRTVPKNSAEEIDVLLAWTRLLGFEGNKEASLVMVEKAINIAKSIGYKEGEARAYIYKSMNQVDLIGADPSLPLLEKGLQLSQAIGARNVEIFALYNYAEHFLYHKNNINRALEIIQEAIAKFDKSVNHKNKGNVYKVFGLCLEDLGNIEGAFEAYEKALYHFEQVGENPDINPILKRPNADAIDGGLLNQGQILIYIGKALLKTGQIQQAKSYVEKARKLYTKANTASYVAWTYQYLSDIAQHEGDYETAIQYLQKARFIYEELDEKRYISEVLKSFGGIYQKLNDLEQASINYEKSITIDYILQDTLSLLEGFFNIGNINISALKINEALPNLQTARDFALTIKDSILLPKIYLSIGKVWDLKNEQDSALFYFKQSILIMQPQKKYTPILDAQLNLANLFHRYKQQDSALYYTQQIQTQLAQYGTLRQHKLTHELFGKIYAATGDFEKAYKHHQLFFTYHDSLYTETTQQIAKAEQIRQNIEEYKTQQEAATLKAQLLASQNNLYLALALGLFSLLALGLYLFLQLRKNKTALEDKNQQLADLNATKDKFFKIIAHDIRSPIMALDSVGEQMEYYLSKNNETKLRRLAERVETTAKRLTNLLDNLLNWALLQTGMIPYHPKAIDLKMVVDEVIQLYEPLAETKNIILANEVFDDVKVFADPSALNTIIRNLVNNALKFTSKGGQVRISSKEQDSKVYIIINDTGTGIHAEKLERLFTVDRKSTNGTAGEQGSGLGLILCKELVELNKGTIRVVSELGKGSTFSFSIPKVKS